MVLQLDLDTEGFNVDNLKSMLEEEGNKVRQLLDAMKANPDKLDINDMFTMQLAMNQYSQFGEMTFGIAAAFHSAAMSAARNVKT